MGVLLAYTSMYHVHEMSKQARGEHLIPWNWSYRQLLAAMYVLELKPGPLKEHLVLLNH